MRRPPSATRTDRLVAYTTLVRSPCHAVDRADIGLARRHRLHRRAVTASQDDAAEEVPLVREIHRRVAQGMAAALGVGGIHRRAASLEVGELADRKSVV